jgi:hypothetical protein
MEGLQIFKIYLNFFGFIDYHRDSEVDLKDLTKSGKSDGFRYIEYHGAIDRDIREANKKIYNDKENMHGRVVKIIMLSPAGAEGITLRNVRQVHILEPYWNMSRLEQVIGRGIRFCSHKDVNIEKRYVKVYIYLATIPTEIAQKEKVLPKFERTITVDEHIYQMALTKLKLILQFEEVIKTVAIDKLLFQN